MYMLVVVQVVIPTKDMEDIDVTRVFGTATHRKNIIVD